MKIAIICQMNIVLMGLSKVRTRLMRLMKKRMPLFIEWGESIGTQDKIYRINFCE